MLVTGVAQLVAAPIAVGLERRVDARILTLGGFSLFAVGLGLSASQTWETDFDEMLLPQILRGSAIMFCLLPPTRLALGHFPPERVADASGLFNLMRNLGGAIGLALIDTVLRPRADPCRGDRPAPEAWRRLGVAPGRYSARDRRDRRDTHHDAALIETMRPLVERAGLVSAINEAWAMLAVITALALLVLPLVRTRPRSS